MTLRSDPFQLVGSTLDGVVRVDTVVGEGGFGVVYRGYHQGFGAEVAVKVLKIDRRLRDDERARFLDKFNLEARILYQLSSATLNVVRPLHFGGAETAMGFAPYCVMEWLDGAPLDRVLARRREQVERGELAAGRRVAELTPLFDPLAEAIERAHGLGVVHRDIKPANVFLLGPDASTPGGVKLLDFGIAKLLDLGGERTAAPTLSGGTLMALTPEYAAPEQWDATIGEVGSHTDLYAFALLLLEVLLDRHPLRGRSPMQLMGASCNRRKRPTPRAQGMQVSDELEARFAAALAVDPAARPRSVAAWWRAVKTAAAGDPAHRRGSADGAAAAGDVGRAQTVAQVIAGRSRLALAETQWAARPGSVPDATRPPADATLPPRTTGPPSRSSAFAAFAATQAQSTGPPAPSSSATPSPFGAPPSPFAATQAQSTGPPAPGSALGARQPPLAAAPAAAPSAPQPAVSTPTAPAASPSWRRTAVVALIAGGASAGVVATVVLLLVRAPTAAPSEGSGKAPGAAARYWPAPSSYTDGAGPWSPQKETAKIAKRRKAAELRRKAAELRRRQKEAKLRADAARAKAAAKAMQRKATREGRRAARLHRARLRASRRGAGHAKLAPRPVPPAPPRRPPRSKSPRRVRLAPRSGAPSGRAGLSKICINYLRVAWRHLRAKQHDEAIRMGKHVVRLCPAGAYHGWYVIGATSCTGARASEAHEALKHLGAGHARNLRRYCASQGVRL